MAEFMCLDEAWTFPTVTTQPIQKPNKTYVKPTMGYFQQSCIISAEDEKRRQQGDPFLGRTCKVAARVGSFCDKLAYVEVKGIDDHPFHELCITAVESMKYPNDPLHCTIPGDGKVCMNELLRREGYVLTMNVEKWSGPKHWGAKWGWADFSTTYRITGGSFYEVLQKFQHQYGFKAPRDVFHIST